MSLSLFSSVGLQAETGRRTTKTAWRRHRPVQVPMSRLRVRSYLTKSFSQSAHPGTSRPRGTGISPLSPLERFRAGLEEPTDLSKRDGYGYYPGTIGQRMAAGPDDDFIIVRKLGWGGTSNVWLARHEPHRSK